MFKLNEKKRRLKMTISVTAHPNSKKSRVEGDLLGTLHVYVNEPPIDGRANAKVITLLSEYFNVDRSNVFLSHGEKSKNKIFEISGL